MRSRNGERNCNATLSDDQCQQIRDLYIIWEAIGIPAPRVPRRYAARWYGVSISTISNIGTGKSRAKPAPAVEEQLRYNELRKFIVAKESRERLREKRITDPTYGQVKRTHKRIPGTIPDLVHSREERTPVVQSSRVPNSVHSNWLYVRSPQDGLQQGEHRDGEGDD